MTDEKQTGVIAEQREEIVRLTKRVARLRDALEYYAQTAISSRAVKVLAIDRESNELEQAKKREERLRLALLRIANSDYAKKDEYPSDYLWLWCRSEDTARQALDDTQHP